MKKIIIAIFIVIATLGIAAGTTAKKAPVKTTSKTTTTTKKSTSTPKKEVTDPYVGWYYHAYDQALTDAGEGLGVALEDIDTLIYISKENGKYYERLYYGNSAKKVKLELCKINQGGNKEEINPKDYFQNFKSTNLKKATKTQLENLKWNLENATWRSQKECDAIG